jgi:5-methyltetrahydrofolate--homocysteine methyltransferase
VGGAPLTQDFADRIGAQGYAPDAASAVTLVNRLVARTPHPGAK